MEKPSSKMAVKKIKEEMKQTAVVACSDSRLNKADAFFALALVAIANDAPKLFKQILTPEEIEKVQRGKVEEDVISKLAKDGIGASSIGAAYINAGARVPSSIVKAGSRRVILCGHTGCGARHLGELREEAQEYGLDVNEFVSVNQPEEHARETYGRTHGKFTNARIIAGYVEFDSGVYRIVKSDSLTFPESVEIPNQKLSEELLQGQKPEKMVVAPADVIPEVVDSSKGSVFPVTAGENEKSSIFYGAKHLKIPLLEVVGRNAEESHRMAGEMRRYSFLAGVGIVEKIA